MRSSPGPAAGSAAGSAAALFERASRGDRRALARVLSLVEQGGEPAREIGRLAYPASGDAYTVGMTGAPGAGKSTLTSALVAVMRRQVDRLAVLAIDPSSPFTGGAILGDRVRMQDHYLDPGVFIRSMATRGHLGGLALAAPEAVRVLAAVGHAWVIVETVGVGQVEVEIAGAADTTVVVVNPGWGDSVQANKAGLLEIADVFVINKADRPLVKETQRDLEMMLDLSDHNEWRPPILTTVAARREGVDALFESIEGHRRHLSASGALATRRARRITAELGAIVARRLDVLARSLCTGASYAQLEAAVVEHRLDPWAAADELLRGLGA